MNYSTIECLFEIIFPGSWTEFKPEVLCTLRYFSSSSRPAARGTSCVWSFPLGRCTWMLRVALPEALNTRVLTYRWRFSLRSYHELLSKLWFIGWSLQCFGHVRVVLFSTASHFVGNSLLDLGLFIQYDMYGLRHKYSSLSSEYLILTWQEKNNLPDPTVNYCLLLVKIFSPLSWQLHYCTQK